MDLQGFDGFIGFVLLVGTTIVVGGVILLVAWLQISVEAEGKHRPVKIDRALIVLSVSVIADAVLVSLMHLPLRPIPSIALAITVISFVLLFYAACTSGRSIAVVKYGSIGLLIMDLRAAAFLVVASVQSEKLPPFWDHLLSWGTEEQFFFLARALRF